MFRSIRHFFNSILGHTVMLVFAMLALFVSTTLVALAYRSGPSTQSLNLYEIGRLLQGLPIGKDSTALRVHLMQRAGMPPFEAPSLTEQLFEEGLAAQLHTPRPQVRVSLAPGPQIPLDLLEREHRLFSGEGHFQPLVYGPFNIAVRVPNGSWRILIRSGTNPQAIWQRNHLLFISIWLLGGALLAWWLSSRITMPIRRFSEAAERLGSGERVATLPLDGPLELRRAGQAFNDMQARLERYVAERTSVAGAIAHDLRGPLSRLSFLLASAPTEIGIEAQHEIYEMEQIINVTLQFVENDARPQKKELLDLSMLVEGIVDELADMGRDVTVHTVGETLMQGDALQLRRLFANLIDNSLKYGAGAKVKVHGLGDAITVDVEDAGPGMAPQDIDRAFEPFFRGEPSRNRSTGGVGLGLAIVKSAVEAHDGQINLVNLPAIGLRARVILPAITAG